MKALVVGASGRMGQEIIAILESLQGAEYVGGIDRKNPISDFSGEADVVIDFSLPELTLDVVEFCRGNQVALVSGVTGLQESQLNLLKDLSNEKAVLWAPNMSLGITWLNEALKTLGSLEGFRYEIEETHHVHKKDAPSGTAVFLHETLKSIDPSVAEPKSIREGEVFGIHKIKVESSDEKITLEHEALNRRVFAEGAVKAALWINGRKEGFYNLKDVLGL